MYATDGLPLFVKHSKLGEVEMEDENIGSLLKEM